jgi:hypothetical protein
VFEKGRLSIMQYFVVLQVICLLILSLGRTECRYFGPSRISSFKKVFQLRGGQSEALATEKANLNTQKAQITVTTSVGSQFLDKKKKFIISPHCTVGELKLLLKQKFPGSPPPETQRLFHGGNLLEDNETIENIAPSNSATILLDMMTGTAGYSKNLTVSQAIEAYASTVTQLAFVGDKLKTLINSDSMVLDNSTIESYHYRELFEILNASLHSKYSEDIAIALESEKNPEVTLSDITKWKKETGQVNPVFVTLAKEFALNPGEIKNYLFFSFILVVSFISLSLSFLTQNRLLIYFFFTSRLWEYLELRVTAVVGGSLLVFRSFGLVK